MGDNETIDYSTTEIREIIRHWKELDPMTDYVIDVKTAAEQLDVVDKAVFIWAVEGLTYQQIGERVNKYNRDTVTKPIQRGRYAVARMVRNIQYALSHPWLKGK